MHYTSLDNKESEKIADLYKKISEDAAKKLQELQEAQKNKEVKK